MSAQTETREEFEARWNGGVIMHAVRRGRISIECHENHIEDEFRDCTGWKMSHVEGLKDDLEVYGNTQAEVDAAIEHRNQLLEKDNNS